MPFDAAPNWRLRRREVILAAASELFAQRSFTEVQVDEVARRAGVGKATLYRYFPSKEGLYLETLERALDDLDGRLADHAPRDGGPDDDGPGDDGPARDRLIAMIRSLIDVLGEQLPTLKLLGADQSGLAEQGRQVLRRRLARIAAALRTVLEEGVASGDFRPMDSEITPILIIGIVRGGIMASGDQPRARLERAILDLVLAGTGRPAGAAASPDISSSDPLSTLAMAGRADTAGDPVGSEP